MAYINDSSSPNNNDISLVGGKAKNLWLLGRQVEEAPVPPWFVLTTDAFTAYNDSNGIAGLYPVINAGNLDETCSNMQSLIMDGSMPDDLCQELQGRLSTPPFNDSFLAVRSSGTDEDSSSHSFAGQFESFLFQKGLEQVMGSVKSCWASCYSQRVMSHRLELGLRTEGIKMAVIVQVMVDAHSSGVAFSRHPLRPLSTPVVFIEAVLGLGEGLVSGELVADQYEVSRDGNFDVTLTLADKVEMMVQDKDGGGVIKVGVNPERFKERALTDDEARKIARLMINLELKMEKPQDFEWAIENGQLYCLQARPIVTLPPSCFFDHSATGSDIILWDNSNIVESYSGVTTPLTFSFVSNAYEKVYTLTLLAAGVPSSVVKNHKPYLANMLGLVRGNIYYNLLSWYRCLTCIPLGDTSKYMETMMGVKQSLDPKIDAEIGYIQSSAPRYSIWVKIKLLLAIMERIYFIDSYVNQFFEMFNRHYKEAIEMDFESLTLQEQIKYIKHLNESVLGNWSVPIYNDTYVMIFFGLLKKLVSKYLTDDIDKAQSLQNDLLCGQGDVESTEPTKMLMRIAEYVDTEVSTDVRGWFMDHKDEVVAMLTDEKERRSKFKASKVNKLENVLSSEGLRRRKNVPISETDSNSTTDPLMKEKLSIIESILKFLDKYGFRCINELKLEENTLHDDPTFVVEAICGYMLTQSYDIFKMEEREMSIRTQAESVVSSTISWPKRTLFNWVLFHARRGVRHRENMRFARTKLFGLFRNLFRAVGTNFVKLELLKERQDVFYLTMDELYWFVEGRSVTNNLSELVQLRKREFESYRRGLAPPERFLTKGTCGIHFLFPQVLDDLDLLKDLEAEASTDPNTLKGTPCCPGIVTNTVRVVTTIKEAEGLNGEILITARTDPGWVPLYPMCSGLVIERGSLLSHSAVVARELGLPTIVGVSGGLMKRLKTGMIVKIDAGKGIVNIMNQDENNKQ